jgi:hypothetical protein
MKPTTGITLPASFVVTVSHTGTKILPTAPAEHDVLSVAEVAELLKCKKSSIYNMTRSRGRARYDNPRCLFCGFPVACDSVVRPFSRGSNRKRRMQRRDWGMQIDFNRTISTYEIVFVL